MIDRRIAARILAAPAAAGVALLSLAGPASAHVTVTPSTTAAGAYTVLTVALSHGCDGSATTEVAIQLPEEIESVAPTRHPLWDVTVEEGTPLTVVYTTKSPLADGVRDSFELSLQLPDAEGETLVFPAIQTCEAGETAWTEVAADGQDGEELEHPAPTVTITAAEGGGHGAAAEPEDHAEPETDTEETESSSLGAVGGGGGGLGLLAGGAALVQVRRRA